MPMPKGSGTIGITELRGMKSGLTFPIHWKTVKTGWRFIYATLPSMVLPSSMPCGIALNVATLYPSDRLRSHVGPYTGGPVVRRLSEG